MKIHHKFLLAFTALLIFQSTALAWNTYSDLAVALARDGLYPLLIEYHVCEDVNQCRSQRRVFAGGTSNQANVGVYKAGDLSPAVIHEIMKQCLEVYTLYARKQTVTLRIYNETAEEVNAFFSRVKPFIYLELKGDE